MREIGGYLELENRCGEILHGEAIALNCGRNCLAYLAELRGIRRIWLPDFLCGSVRGVCEREGIETLVYRVGMNLKPAYGFEFGDEDWLYLVDYYGTLEGSDVGRALELFGGRVVVDEAQGYFRNPWKDADTLYTCRKFFGVVDGAFLATKDDTRLGRELSRDESRERMGFVLGRVERPASEFYAKSKANNSSFALEPVKRMSLLTERLLSCIDYERAKRKREENWRILDEVLGDGNLLWESTGRRVPEGPYMYPYMVGEPDGVREALAQKGVYVPVLWPDAEHDASGSLAQDLSRRILPLPIDQRYGEEEMLRVVEVLRKCTS